MNVDFTQKILSDLDAEAKRLNIKTRPAEPGSCEEAEGFLVCKICELVCGLAEALNSKLLILL